MPEMARRRGIQAASGFIEQENGRSFDQRPRNAEPLIHTAGKLHHQCVGRFQEPGIGKNLIDFFGAKFLGHVIQCREEVQIFPSGKAWKERSLGSDGKSHLLSDLMAFCERVGPCDQDPPGIRQEHG